MHKLLYYDKSIIFDITLKKCLKFYKNIFLVTKKKNIKTKLKETTFIKLKKGTF